MTTLPVTGTGAAQAIGVTAAEGAIDAAIAAAVASEATARNTAIGTAIATEVTNRDAAIASHGATEVAARTAAITAVVSAEATARENADEVLRAAMGGSAIRAGEAPTSFVTIANGAPEGLPAITETAGITTSVVSGLGLAAILDGVAALVAPRAAWPVQVGRMYRAHAYVQRLTDAADPSGNTVRLALRRLDDSFAAVGISILQDRVLSVADSIWHFSATFALAPTAPFEVDVTLSETTVYVRPYVECFTDDHRTAVAQIEILDITEAAAIEGALDAVALASALETAAAEAAAAAASSVLTAGDRGQTAADRVQTGVDSAAATASATAAATSAANAQSSAYTLATWTALNAITGTAAGQGAEVLDADTGTHTDPVVGGTVANAGRFTWSASPAGWKWIGATGLSAKLPTTTFTSRVGNLQANTLAVESGYVWGVQDAANRLALGVDTAGKTWFSPRADLQLPATNLNSAAQARLLPSGLSWDTALPPESGFVWGVRDVLGRLGFGLKADGTFWANLANDAVIPGAAMTGLLPSTTIEAWGDSMTAGAGGGGTTYPAILATALGRTVNNRGIGGQTTDQIAARQGGLSITVTVTSNQIPASGGVSVTVKSTNILYDSGTYTGTSVGTLAGIPGTISTDGSGNWTFTRTTAGSVTACAAGTQFIIDQAVTAKDKTVIIWAGRNDSRSTRTQHIATRDYILGMVNYLSPLTKRLLVVSVCNGTSEGSPSSAYTNIAAVNAELQRTFGDRYVDLRRYLIDFGLADAGLTPIAQDTTDVAADTIPISLRSDTVHLNASGYTVAGNFLARQIKARGW
jgi:lysophospholipase L1-like esterase